jgi:hypothetical protein
MRVRHGAEDGRPKAKFKAAAGLSSFFPALDHDRIGNAIASASAFPSATWERGRQAAAWASPIFLALIFAKSYRIF